MPFVFPEGLAPEVYPLAWLVGRWRGQGVVEYPGIDETSFVHDLVFDHDGGPYLRFESTLRVRSAASADGEGDGATGDDPDTVWSTETGYWRVSTERPDGLEEDRHPLEVLVSDASGRLSLFLGAVGNGRVDLATDFVARTSSGAEVTAAKRLYGLVDGQLMWVEELAAFGHPLGSYASARLDRQTGDEPAPA